MKITIRMLFKLRAFGACHGKCPNNFYGVNSSGIRHESKHYIQRSDCIRLIWDTSDQGLYFLLHVFQDILEHLL